MDIRNRNLEYMNNGYVDTYIIRKHDTLRSLLTSLYRMPPTKSNANLLIWAIYRLNDITSLKSIKVGMELRLPLLMITDDRKYSFNFVDVIIDVTENKDKHECCNSCMSDSDKLYSVIIGCNGSSVSSWLCRHCLSVLYRRVGDVLNE